MTNTRRGTLYIGVTSNLPQRVWQHKHKVRKSFTEKYNLNKLVYYESYESAEHAIKREKRLKFWLREWKIELIELENPSWKDLYEFII
jgi:putative endonuclease